MAAPTAVHVYASRRGRSQTTATTPSPRTVEIKPALDGSTRDNGSRIGESRYSAQVRRERVVARPGPRKRHEQCVEIGAAEFSMPPYCGRQHDQRKHRGDYDQPGCCLASANKQREPHQTDDRPRRSENSASSATRSPLAGRSAQNLRAWDARQGRGDRGRGRSRGPPRSWRPARPAVSGNSPGTAAPAKL